MKVTHLILINLLILVLISCNGTSGSGGPVVKANAEMAIEGMVCAFGCAKSIEDKMNKMEGVISCKVDFEKGNAHFVFDNSVLKSMEIERIIEEMNDGQYKVEVLKEEIDKGESSGENGDETSVTDPVSVNAASFTFPQLATYFMNNL